jgi:murein DD-endopeptidase MepM/ murein hydrolase activator NlpD
MIDTSLRPVHRLGRGQFARYKQVQEAIGEARVALQEIAGLSTPTPRQGRARLRRWVFCCAAGLRDHVWQLRPRWRVALTLAGHLPTLAVILLLGVAVLTQALGFSIAYMAAPEGGEGGVPVLRRGSESSEEAQAFAFAAAPMTVARRQVAAADELPPAGVVIPESANLAAYNEVIVYNVQEGDTLEIVADRYGIAAYTIYWLNGLDWPGNLQPGMKLFVPPISGVPHTVEAGETLDTIADMYGVRPGNIVGYPPNGLKYPYHLTAGQEIFVPGGIIEIPNYRMAEGQRPPPTIVKMPGGEKLSWPTSGEISAPFGWSRGYGGYHNGLDIANDWGTPIYAAAAGQVVEAGWGGLGWYVVIDHENGFSTIYGHMAQPSLVSEGDRVERGQQIGLMGRTYGAGGYATGVHLHFGVRHHGVLIDPLPLLEQ